GARWHRSPSAPPSAPSSGAIRQLPALRASAAAASHRAEPGSAGPAATSRAPAAGFARSSPPPADRTRLGRGSDARAAARRARASSRPAPSGPEPATAAGRVVSSPVSKTAPLPFAEVVHRAARPLKPVFRAEDAGGEGPRAVAGAETDFATRADSRAP